MNQDKIYEELYEITNANLNQQEETLPFTKATFLFASKLKPGYLDLSEFNEFDLQTTLGCAYVGMLYRTPEEEAVANWNKRNVEPLEVMRKKIIESISNSKECSDKGCIIYNNIYSKKNKGVVTLEKVVRNDNVYINKLYNLYKKMPKFMRQAIRFILGK